MAAILAAGSLKQSLEPGAMRDDPTVTINGMKRKGGYTRMSSGTLTSSIITLDRRLWSTLSATRLRKVLADLRSLSVQQEPRSLCLGIKVSMRLALPGKPQANTLSRHLAAPESALATLPPLFASTLLAETTTSATPSGFRKNDFQVALL